MATSTFPGSWECDSNNTSITARITDPDEFSYFSWSLRTADGNTTLQSRGYSLARTVTFGGLTPATTYRVYMSWSHSTSGEGNYDYEYVTTQAVEPPPERPENWSWSSTVRKGASVPLTTVGEKQYEAAYLTASEWNAFWDRLIEFARYKGLSVSGTTNRVSPGDPMLASQANDARTMISLLEPTVELPAEISSESMITAEFINGLANSLNSVK